MVKNKMVISVCAVMLMAATTGAEQVFAADWPAVLQQIKAKYSQFGNDIQDISITQQMTTVAPEGTMVIEMTLLQKGKKFRSEGSMNMPGAPSGMGPMKTTVIFDGKDTWMIAPMMGKKKLSPQESKDQQKDKNWWELVSEQAKITGMEQTGGRECYVVAMNDPENAPFTRMWLDKNNLVLMKMESKGRKREPVVIEFSDFKKVKGEWEMPYKTEMYANGKLMSTIQVKALQVNKGVADEQFDAGKVPVEKQGFPMGDMMKQMMR
ncbi:MAG: outer membrane lipoprotein-sorting protein [Candidatus Omnitrophica bacterium]|nr:outer membrane lipoprotein-sorting protein [Candidatus Omnitrophota bacterium]MBU4479800.1 outer membrane lipoprotein-sorting protein [Candidatus Omnitrophota bacterium]